MTSATGPRQPTAVAKSVAQVEHARYVRGVVWGYGEWGMMGVRSGGVRSEGCSVGREGCGVGIWRVGNDGCEEWGCGEGGVLVGKEG